ncbi:type VI secretion system tip protein VgrG [Burkholderia multivorans]|uniref:type VI secretion system Vgr family protein n=1 Tax=Burkholderia multivorans TaxID=87883 RepID=UPI002018E6C5|nr:type VI secretion system Vgr family protein [Burkholderia multivorans]MCO1373852.1 type VI secretion system tip protein VgrG [Burkholderia multivorans]MCO1454898.1 type VI secretion system tip protein VgrG [Burkholderia multivorans]MCO1469447.1 type VI secretion system tip protein VgrG [Burkholderia multivorans]UQO18992.1 type VI secretion system tip protein VgrG [Burkholderia multivorans]UQO82088.1 type VI secretion system tip protein VgrG [Burkholderia multivorans]
MALFDASRTLSVSGAALPTYGGQSLLTPVKLTGAEAIGELFEYVLELKTPDALAFSPSIAANVDLDALIGTEVTVSIQLEGRGHFIPGLAGGAGMGNIGAGMREITGIVSQATIVREEGRSIVYALTLRPWLWHATKNSDCRIFQDMSVVEITDAVLSVYPFPVDKRLTPPRPNKVWPKRDIQRQHFESDWTFLQRLWEEWGIYYFFEHGEGKHRLVLCDSMGALQPLGDAYAELCYEPPTSRRVDEEHIHEFSVSHALTTGAVAAVDYDYTLPRANLTVAREDPRDTGLAHQERYSWGDYAQPQAGAAGLSGAHNEPRTEAEYLTLVQMQAWRCQGLRAHGKGNLRGMVTGQTFVLSHYPQEAANREYAVIACRLTIEEIGEASGAGQQYRCEAQFTVQPTNEPFRLLRTIAKPRMNGVEYAVVTCPDNQEIWTDAYGRVKLQFLWDRLGKNDERSSCWVRVAGAWHGDQFGGVFLPRRGQEVEVAFVNGDPDLPIVVGSAANAFNMPPFALPANQALAGYRSKEIGGRRANTLAFDDTNGKIQAHLSSDEGCSQLNLGYIARIAGNAGRQEERGRGFELATGLWGVVRSAMGMLITTEAPSNAQSHAKEMDETVRRLAEARDTHERLAELAQQNGGQELNGDQSEVTAALRVQNDAIRGDATTEGDPFPEFAEPHMTLASPAGIETTTAGTTHIASGEHLALTTGEHLGIATGRSLFATVKEKLRIFVYHAGIKFISGAGSIDIEALKDAINLTAKIRIRQTATKIEIWAEEELSLRGGKSFITLSNSGITNGTPGQWQSYAATHEMPGPRSAPDDIPATELKVCELSTIKAAARHAAIVPLR